MSKRRKPGRAIRQLHSGSRRDGGARSAHGNVREAASFVVQRTLQTGSIVDAFLAPALDRCDARDHALLHELVYGTLRWKRRLDHLISQASDRPLHDIEPDLLGPLRIAVYQLFFLDRVPDHAIVHEAVEHATRVTHRGGGGFVNAVLRRLAKSPSLDAWPVEAETEVETLAIELSHPRFLVKRWLERFGLAATTRLLNANNRPKPLHLLAFRDRSGRELLAEKLIDEGINVEPSRLAPFGLKVRGGDALATNAFRGGDFYVQDEASQLAALIPPPAEGETVLDLMAAPGGKSLSLLAFRPSVRPVLHDASMARLLLVRQNLRRLDRPMPIVLGDAVRPTVSGLFDRVVADLPCSGTGTFRKNPELKWRSSPEDIDRLATAGLAMLERATERVRPGGLLCAITCSLEREENEDVVASLRAKRPELKPVPRAEMMPCRAELGDLADGFWRLLPGADHDGFTVHALRKRG